NESRQREALAAGHSVAVAKGVELLSITKALAGLPLDPGAEADLQRAVLGFERTRRQRLGGALPAAPGQPDRQDSRLVDARRDDRRRQPDRQRRARGERRPAGRA